MERKTNNSFYVTHVESWIFPQEERAMAISIAEGWRKNGRTVAIKEDTGSIKVETYSAVKYERGDEV